MSVLITEQRSPSAATARFLGSPVLKSFVNSEAASPNILREARRAPARSLRPHVDGRGDRRIDDAKAAATSGVTNLLASVSTVCRYEARFGAVSNQLLVVI